eukprot:ANDGO_02178.mRNA.1 hypothetical protein
MVLSRNAYSTRSALELWVRSKTTMIWGSTILAVVVILASRQYINNYHKYHDYVKGVMSDDDGSAATANSYGVPLSTSSWIQFGYGPEEVEPKLQEFGYRLHRTADERCASQSRRFVSWRKNNRRDLALAFDCPRGTQGLVRIGEPVGPGEVPREQVVVLRGYPEIVVPHDMPPWKVLQASCAAVQDDAVVQGSTFLLNRILADGRVEASTVSSRANEQPTLQHVVVMILDAVGRENVLRALPATAAFLQSSNAGYEVADFEKFNAAGRNTVSTQTPLWFHAHSNMRWKSTKTVTKEDASANPFFSDTIAGLPIVTARFSQLCRMVLGHVHGFANSAALYDHFFYGQDCEATAQVWNMSRDERTCHNGIADVEVIADMMELFLESHSAQASSTFSIVDLQECHIPDLTICANSDRTIRRMLEYLMVQRKDTIAWFMSDHGLHQVSEKMLHAFSHDILVKQIVSPFLFLLHQKNALPLQFKQHLRLNSKRLVTAFDLHKTLLDLLQHVSKSSIESERVAYLQSSNITGSVSLLRSEVPLKRTCDEAGIDDWFCIPKLKSLRTCDNETSSMVAALALQFINEQIDLMVRSVADENNSRARCQPVRLHSVTLCEIQDGSFVSLMFNGQIATVWSAVYSLKDGGGTTTRNAVQSVRQVSSYNRFENCQPPNVVKELCVCAAKPAR